MKKLIIFTLCVILNSTFLILHSFAQAPEKINYQGVARNTNGETIPDQTIGLKITLHSAANNGPVVYEETHNATTNHLGLFNIEIGGGKVSGSYDFSAINWGANAYFIQTEMDITGGTRYLNMGTQQLVSVPFALYAKTSGNALASGETVIKEHGTATAGVWVEFSNEFASALKGNKPFINITPVSCNEGFFISEQTDKGFMVKKNIHVRTEEIFTFNWQAEVGQERRSGQ